MQPTRDTSTLDLMFTDTVEYYEIPAILTPLSTSDHNVVNWKSKCNIAEKGNLTKIKVRQFQHQQLEQFDAILANYNWSSIFNTSGIDRKVNTFTNYWKYDFWIIGTWLLKTKKLNLWEASENELRQRFREQRSHFTRIK